MSGDERGGSRRSKGRRSRSASPPPKRDRDDRKNRRRRNSSSRSDEEEDRSDRRRDYRDRRRRRSRSPYDRRERRNDRRGDKPVIPQRPKLFQRPPDASTSNEETKSWTTRIAAVASDDNQRSKFEKLLGMHKKDSGGDTTKSSLNSVADTEIKSMRDDLNKMQSDLDAQYEQGRAFTHAFRGRGL